MLTVVLFCLGTGKSSLGRGQFSIKQNNIEKILLTGTYYHTGGMYSQLEYSEIGITSVWMPMSEAIKMGKAKY
jgi:hypothetical protein